MGGPWKVTSKAVFGGCWALKNNASRCQMKGSATQRSKKRMTSMIPPQRLRLNACVALWRATTRTSTPSFVKWKRKSPMPKLLLVLLGVACMCPMGATQGLLKMTCPTSKLDCGVIGTVRNLATSNWRANAFSNKKLTRGSSVRFKCKGMKEMLIGLQKAVTQATQSWMALDYMWSCRRRGIMDALERLPRPEHKKFSTKRQTPSSILEIRISDAGAVQYVLDGHVEYTSKTKVSSSDSFHVVANFHQTGSITDISLIGAKKCAKAYEIENFDCKCHGKVLGQHSAKTEKECLDWATAKKFVVVSFNANTKKADHEANCYATKSCDRCMTALGSNIKVLKKCA